MWSGLGYFSKYIREGYSCYFDEECFVKGKIQKNSIKNINVNRRIDSYSKILIKNLDYIIQSGNFLDVIISVLKRDDTKCADRERIEDNLNVLCNNQHLCLFEQMFEMEQQQWKSNRFYDLLVRWVKIKQKGVDIVAYFIHNNIRHIAIYGMKELGHLLFDELRNTEVNVDYVIDRNPKIHTDSWLISPESELPEVDMIVVMAVFYYDEIKGYLQDKTSAKIISLFDILIDLEIREESEKQCLNLPR